MQVNKLLRMATPFVYNHPHTMTIDSIDDRQYREIKVLYQVAQAGTEATHLDELITKAIQLLRETFPPTVDFGIGLVDEEKNNLNAHTYFKGDLKKYSFPLKEGVIGRVIKSGKPELIRNTDRDPEYVNLFPGMRSVLCVPLKSGEGVIGVINAESEDLDAFSDVDEQLMGIFADQMATAIERVRLLQQSQRSSKRGEVFSNAIQEISASLEVEQVFTAIQNAVSALMPWDSFLISLVDEDAQELEDIYLIEDGERYPSARYPMDEGLSAYVVSSGDALHYNDFDYKNPAIEPIIVGILITRSIIIVPMVCKGQVTGVLSVQSSQANAYSDEDCELLKLLASHAASAVENAKLYAEVQRLAILDPLTGIFNRRHFFDLAKQEFERIRRFSHPLSIIMIDIDHFKNVNDTLGHLAGDIALRTVAENCKKIVRSTDILCRFGGEEFAILLIETSPIGAMQIAERLCIEISKVNIDFGKIKISLTASLGVAHYSEGYNTIEDLLACADRALYEAKRGGRNQVSEWCE